MSEIVYDDIFIAVRNPNPLEETIERITGVIKARLLDLGDRLPPERELALQLGVSRSTLRLALQNLVDAGWLEVRRGRAGGSFVARWPHVPSMPGAYEILHRHRSKLPELFDYRRAVEGQAAFMAAERATAESIQVLDALTADVQCDNKRFVPFRAVDSRFHIALARSAASPLVLYAVTQVHESLTEVLDVLMYHSDSHLPRATSVHRHIFEAVRDRNADEARRLMLQHMAHTEELLSSLPPATNS